MLKQAFSSYDPIHLLIGTITSQEVDYWLDNADGIKVRYEEKKKMTFQFPDVITFDVQESGNEAKWYFTVPVYTEDYTEYQLSILFWDKNNLQAAIMTYLSLYR